MTERLTDLLHAEADGLDVPSPAAHDVIVRGRGLRRRRRTTRGAAAGVVLVLAVGGAVTATTTLGDDRRGEAVEDPPRSVADMGAVFSVGTTLYYDDGRRQVRIPDKAIKSVYLTSAGVLVRSGNNTNSDGGGPQRFQLVTPDGQVRPVSVVTEEVSPGVDASQPYLAYPEVVDGTVEVVVHDVVTDDEVARVPVPGADPDSLSAQGVALSGDEAYLAAGSETEQQVVDWRTGEVRTVSPLSPGLATIDGGRISQGYGDTASVVDVDSGEVLLSVPTGGYGYFVLSPDGRFARLDTGAGGGREFELYAVDTGRHRTFPGRAFRYGWTADGDLVEVQGRKVTICDQTTGECSTSPFDGQATRDDTRILGRTYES